MLLATRPSLGPFTAEAASNLSSGSGSSSTSPWGAPDPRQRPFGPSARSSRVDRIETRCWGGPAGAPQRSAGHGATTHVLARRGIGRAKIGARTVTPGGRDRSDHRTCTRMRNALRS